MKKTKLAIETSDDINKSCDYTGLYIESSSSSVVTKVERVLKTESSEERYENMTSNDLKIAAEMFIYLHVCPYYRGQINEKWFKSWSSFYDDLFLTESPNQIILTINRMMNVKTSLNENDKLRAQKLFKRVTRSMSLSYKDIESLLPGKEPKNGSINDQRLNITIGIHFLMIL